MTVDELLKKFPCLTPDDLRVETGDEEAIVIIENSGTQKLMDHFSVSYKIEDSEVHPYNYNHKGAVQAGFIAKVHVSGRANKGGVSKRTHHTVSSCHHKNSDWDYEVELAEVRAIAKLTRKIAGIYGNGNIISSEEYYEKKKNRKSLDAIKNRESSLSEEHSKKQRERIKQRLSNIDAKRGI